MMPPSPRVVEAAKRRAIFLTSGRPRPGPGQMPKNLLALSSWQPYPLARRRRRPGRDAAAGRCGCCCKATSIR